MNDLEKLAENAEKACNLLKSMSNRDRLMILCMLIDTELSVSDLNKTIPLSQSALSQHLAILRNNQLVSTRRKSQTIYYRVQGEAPIRVISLLKELFCNEEEGE